MTTYHEPTTIPTETEIAYIAGLFDADGCVTIFRKVNRNGRRYHTMSVTIASRDHETLEWVQARTGGGIYRSGMGIGQRRASFHLKWSNALTEEFLRMVAPYAIAKREVIALGLAFRATVPPSKKGVPLGLPASVVERREQLHSQLAAINGYLTKERR